MSAESGWRVLDGLLDAKHIDAITSDLRRLLDEPPERRAAGDKPAAGTRHLEELDMRSEPIAQLLEDERLRSAVSEWLPDAGGPVQVSYRSPQRGNGGQYLHADDMARLATQPTSVVTAIVALTDFTETNGATRLVSGSHLRPDLQRSSGRLDRHPDEELVLLRSGSALVFDGHVLHSGTLNASTAERPALQIVWRA